MSIVQFTKGLEPIHVSSTLAWFAVDGKASDTKGMSFSKEATHLLVGSVLVCSGPFR